MPSFSPTFGNGFRRALAGPPGSRNGVLAPSMHLATRACSVTAVHGGSSESVIQLTRLPTNRQAKDLDSERIDRLVCAPLGVRTRGCKKGP